jgi:hypothetical protein
MKHGSKIPMPYGNHNFPTKTSVSVFVFPFFGFEVKKILPEKIIFFVREIKVQVFILDMNFIASKTLKYFAIYGLVQ